MGTSKRDRYKDVQNFWGNPEANEAHAKKAVMMGERKAIYQRDCRWCGTPLAFGICAGKVVPLDLKAPVYVVIYEKSEARKNMEVVRTMLAFVNHFSTCPHTKEVHEAYEKESQLGPV